MASKTDNLTKKQRYIAESEVCAKNIFVLSNSDVKIVLSKYNTLSPEEKSLVRQFSTYLQLHHFNRFRNLSKCFQQAYDSDKRVFKESKDVKISINTSNKSEQKIVIYKPSTNNNSVAPKVNQEITAPPFHTNIISRVKNNNNENIAINPFYSTVFPMIHQKVLSQCISSVLLPQTILNNTVNNVTAVLNLKQNMNPTCEPVNNQINTPVHSQNQSVNNPPSKFKSENSDKKIENSKERHRKPVKHNESKNSNKSKNKKKSLRIQTKLNKIKKPIVVQDLESFSMEHMKKIESFAQRDAQRNSIKFNLSSNSQIKISQTCSKIEEHTESKIINLNGIKPFFDNTETNLEKTEHKIAKETNIIKTSCDQSDKRLIEYPTDNLKDDKKIVKSKVIQNSSDIIEEKCSLYSKDTRKNVPSKSDFLEECNVLKSIISKNSNEAENSSKKLQKLKIILTKKSRQRRRRNKFKNQGSEIQKHTIEDQPIVIVQEKNQIDLPDEKTIPVEKFETKENNEQIEIPKKEPQKREVKVVNRLLRANSPNDQIIKSISEKPFTEECNKVTNDIVLVTKQDVKCKLDKTMDTEDLMVLLKYFYKLDGLEQHRLIEFLKELELTEPERVADLRKHVRTSPPNDEDNTVLQNPKLGPDKKDPIELDDRPESRNSDLSNIDLILEDIDSILNDEDDEESSNNKEESTEPPSKRLKTDLKTNEHIKTNNTTCGTTNSSENTIPVPFKDSQNYTFNFNQNLNNYSNNTPVIQYNNFIQQNINYISHSQNYELNHQNQYFQNNFQEAYQLNSTQLFIQNESYQDPQNMNYFQDFQNYYYDFNNPVDEYQQYYSNYQNDEYFQ